MPEDNVPGIHAEQLQSEATDGEQIRRRDLLRATGAVGVGGLVAGSDPVAATETDTDAEFAAELVALDEAVSEDGYQLLDGGSVVATTEDDVGYESQWITYDGDPRYALFATPDLTAEGYEPSRPARGGAGEFLVTTTGRELLAILIEMDMAIEWTEEPEIFTEQFGDREPVLLETDAEMVTLVGVVNEQHAVLAHVSRVTHGDDVVFAVDVRRRIRESSDQPLLGDEDAVFQASRLSTWWDVHCRLNLAVEQHDITDWAICGWPAPEIKFNVVSISDPANDETIRCSGSGTAKMLDSGETLEVTSDEYNISFVDIDLTASVDACYDVLEWRYWPYHGPACKQGTRDGGTGKTTTITLSDCGKGANWAIEVRALDAQGNEVTGAVRTISIAELNGC